ncbi:MAG: hypothetical protein DHS20C11_32200 [Lysobacteraceae bacterium]|nr:MAG: hypothetical protein DHS20C11_32200 [Xanthomonadaceae bacterium]
MNNFNSLNAVEKPVNLTIKSALVVFLLVLSTCVSAMNLQQAVRKVQSETGGKVLSAQTIKDGKREVHKIKVLMPNGRVRVISVQGDRPDRWQRQYWKRGQQATEQRQALR